MIRFLCVQEAGKADVSPFFLEREIIEKQQHQGWGSKIIGTLAYDQHSAFPAMKGFSPTNLKYMRRFV